MGIYARPGVGAGAIRFESPRAESPDEILAEDTASRVPGTQEQDFKRPLRVHNFVAQALLRKRLAWSIVRSPQDEKRKFLSTRGRRFRSDDKIGSLCADSAKHLRLSSTSRNLGERNR